VRGVAGALARLVAPAYAWEVARRNRAFDAGRGVTRLDRPVVSVGNLTLGGTGKTPMVMTLARGLLDAGVTPCIAMRGYRAGPEGSDEAREYAAALPGVPVVVGADRVAGLRELFASEEGARVGCVLLDDGFQHRKIARDMDLVLIDATRRTLDDRVFPAGWLREPVGSLARATHVVITRAESVSEHELRSLVERVRALSPRARVGACEHAWTALDVHEPGGSATIQQPVEWLRGRRVLAVCAIGNPIAFIDRVCGAIGAEGHVETLALRDHDAYGAAAMDRVREGVERHTPEAVITTPKDWTKLAHRERPGVAFVVPRLGLAFHRAGTNGLGVDEVDMDEIGLIEHVRSLCGTQGAR
jgi:tetraacyldisaccharide 4'-kinase